MGGGIPSSLGLGYPSSWDRGAPRKYMSPVELLWDGVPPRKDIGPVGVLCEGDGVNPGVNRHTPVNTVPVPPYPSDAGGNNTQ